MFDRSDSQQTATAADGDSSTSKDRQNFSFPEAYSSQGARPDSPKLSLSDQNFLNEIEKTHFQYFKQECDAQTGLTRDRSRDDSASSVAAVGFALTAYPVAVKNGWVSREEAADYTLKVLNTLWKAPQGDQQEGTSGTHGFFYHFLDPKTGTRAQTNEISTMDTALLMSGVLFSKDYFDANNPKEAEIRELADKLYRRVDWNWALNSSGRLSMGWTPERGFIKDDWRAYNEAPLLILMAMSSPTHPIPASSWETYMSTGKVAEFNGKKSVEFGPMFGHQYSQIWIDFRGLNDATTNKLGFDYFENSRRATLAQHEYAVSNPHNWRGYGTLDWGLTASDGPGGTTKQIDGKEIQFQGYAARGYPDAADDGTIAPTAAAASLPFAPEVVIPTLKHWRDDRPEILGPLGFQDAFNPTFDESKKSGWVDPDTLGIDQGPILLMTENYLSGFVWKTMATDPYLQSGLHAAGFKRTGAVAANLF
jgi:hypothetical protein